MTIKAVGIRKSRRSLMYEVFYKPISPKSPANIEKVKTLGLRLRVWDKTGGFLTSKSSRRTRQTNFNESRK